MTVSFERRVVPALIGDEGKLRLRILGMNEERCAPVHVGAQQAQAFVGRIPGLHHDVIQLVAQEVFHHSFVARLDFEEIRQHSGRSVPALHCARLKQPAHRFGRISMLGDDGLERSFLAEGCGIFRADRVEVTSWFRSPAARLLSRRLTRAADFCGQAAGSLRDGFKLQRDLAALSAEGFRPARSRWRFRLAAAAPRDPTAARRSCDWVSWLRRFGRRRDRFEDGGAATPAAASSIGQFGRGQAASCWHCASSCWAAAKSAAADSSTCWCPVALLFRAL